MKPTEFPQLKLYDSSDEFLNTVERGLFSFQSCWVGGIWRCDHGFTSFRIDDSTDQKHLYTLTITSSCRELLELVPSFGEFHSQTNPYFGESAYKFHFQETDTVSGFLKKFSFGGCCKEIHYLRLARNSLTTNSLFLQYAKYFWAWSDFTDFESYLQSYPICRRCSRDLTHYLSIWKGIGPCCEQKPWSRSLSPLVMSVPTKKLESVITKFTKYDPLYAAHLLELKTIWRDAFSNPKIHFSLVIKNLLESDSKFHTRYREEISGWHNGYRNYEFADLQVLNWPKEFLDETTITS